MTKPSKLEVEALNHSSMTPHKVLLGVGRNNMSSLWEDILVQRRIGMRYSLVLIQIRVIADQNNFGGFNKDKFTRTGFKGSGHY